MKAVVIDKPFSVKIQNVNTPEPQPDQVLVKVCYCGICATDLDIYKGIDTFVDNIHYPVRIGHEWSGIVERIGADVKHFKPGDRVAGDSKITCGLCDACKNGDWGNCQSIRSIGTIGDNWDGALAEYIVIPEKNLFLVPDNVSLQEAAVIEPVAIAMNALVHTKVSEGKSVLVIGTGPIGLGAVAIAKALGASKVYLAGRNKLKLDIGKSMGADAVINSTEQDLEAFITQQTEGKKAGAVIETSGNINAVYQSLDCVSRMGSIALVGFYDKPINNLNLNDFVLNKVSFIGASGTNEYFPSVLSYLVENEISLSMLVTQTFDLDNIQEAIDIFNNKNILRIKVLVRIAGE